MTKSKVACWVFALSVITIKAFGCEDLILETGSIISPPPGSQYAVGYFQIKNISQKKVVIKSFSSTFFDSIAIHRTSHSHSTELSKMRLVNELSIAPQETLIGESGGTHLMIKILNDSYRFTDQHISLSVSCENRVSSEMIFLVSHRESTH
jgi:copper(I)-binding protein